MSVSTDKWKLISKIQVKYYCKYIKSIAIQYYIIFIYLFFIVSEGWEYLFLKKVLNLLCALHLQQNSKIQSAYIHNWSVENVYQSLIKGAQSFSCQILVHDLYNRNNSSCQCKTFNFALCKTEFRFQWEGELLCWRC